MLQQQSLFTNVLYPNEPAFRRDSEASKDAAELISKDAESLREWALQIIHDKPMTAQQVTDRIAMSLWKEGKHFAMDFNAHVLECEKSVKPRLSELVKSGRIEKATDRFGKAIRRHNRNKTILISVWRATN